MNHSKPVFVDRSGRRRQLVTALATAGAVVLTAAVLIVTAGFFGMSPGRLPGLPGLPELGKAPQGATVAPNAGGPSPSASATAPRPTATPSAGRSATATGAASTAPTAAPGNSPTRGSRPTQKPVHPTPSKKK